MCSNRTARILRMALDPAYSGSSPGLFDDELLQEAERVEQELTRISDESINSSPFRGEILMDVSNLIAEDNMNSQNVCFTRGLGNDKDEVQNKKNVNPKNDKSTLNKNGIDLDSANKTNYVHTAVNENENWVPVAQEHHSEAEEEAAMDIENSNEHTWSFEEKENNLENKEGEVPPNKTVKESRKRENVRKRVPKKETWKVNIRQKLYQSGKEYVSVRGKRVPAKKITNLKDCNKSCKFNCFKNISETDRKHLFNYYYSLDQNEKYLFLSNVTEKYSTCRKTVPEPSRRCYSFKYFFKIREERIRVCKHFFLGTLNISQKPIYTVHTVDTFTPKKSMRGKTSSRKISDEDKRRVLEHINLFPVVESHYCRANTKRKYLESTLSVSKMYDLYLEYCQENELTPVKLSMYRRIFNTNFNYGFHVPKKDICEKCSRFYIKKKEASVTESQQEEMDKHLLEKEAMRKEKKNDKASGTPVLTFDLENVITCPRTYVGNHFYLQKLNMYNLTGHLSTTNTSYCVIWIETLQGRTGNCLASAVKKIIERVLVDNHIEHLITWSDSCVPQNRNSFMAFCMLDILRNQTELKDITMKYSIPGHSAVQEVDNIHSQIEKHMKLKEFYSPLSFMRELKCVNRRKPFVIMQMRHEDFFNFEECAAKLNYNRIPFSKVAVMKFEKNNINSVSFKHSHTNQDFSTASIYDEIPRATRQTAGSKRTTHQALLSTLKLNVLPKKRDLPQDKVTVIKRLLKDMPEADKQFYKALLSL